MSVSEDLGVVLGLLPWLVFLGIVIFCEIAALLHRSGERRVETRPRERPAHRTAAQH